MQNFSKYGTFKFKEFSRTFKGLEFFPQIQGLSRTSQGPYEPCQWPQLRPPMKSVLYSLGTSKFAYQLTIRL